MIRSMAVAFDQSDEAHDALFIAIDLSHRLAIPLTVIHSVGLLEVASRDSSGDIGAIEDSVTKMCRMLGLNLGDLSIELRTLDSSPVEGVKLLVDDENIDLVVVGSRGHSIDDSLLGSTSHQLIEHLGRPVLVVPRMKK
ncbi:MAG: universal stress protein [Actinomycetota bacterium]|nr:universal stress protein [Actinomycetota bacterium]